MKTIIKDNTSDSELIMLYNEREEDAKNILYDRYGYIINLIINKYKSVYKKLNIDDQEIYSEATLGFSDALNNYRDDKNTSLATFITICIERKLYKLVKKYTTMKHKIASDSMSLDYVYESLDRPLLEILSDDSKFDPLKNMSEEESYKELKKRIKEELSDIEYEVYTLMLSEYNYKQIASILEKEPKQIDNTIQRIRNKIKSIIEN